MRNKYIQRNNELTNENFEIYKEDGRHYLRVDFDYEDKGEIYKCYIDKLKFDLKIKEFSLEGGINVSSAKVRLENVDDCLHEEVTFRTPVYFAGTPLFKVELVKEKAQEMTVEEIEKKLGHKIKIVSK